MCKYKDKSTKSYNSLLLKEEKNSLFFILKACYSTIKIHTCILKSQKKFFTSALWLSHHVFGHLLFIRFSYTKMLILMLVPERRPPLLLLYSFYSTFILCVKFTFYIPQMYYTKTIQLNVFLRMYTEWKCRFSFLKNILWVEYVKKSVVTFT